MKQGDLFEAKAARDAALDKVEENSGEFSARALQAIGRLEPGEWTGESIRLHLESLGIRPHHHNAWGAVINHAIKAELLFMTGRVAHMATAKSHARRTPVYLKMT